MLCAMLILHAQVDMESGKSMEVFIDIEDTSIPCFFNETSLVVQEQDHDQSTVSVWEWGEKCIINQFVFPNHGGPHAWGFQLDRSGNLVNVTQCQKKLEVRDVGSGRRLHSFDAHKDDIVAICVHGNSWLTLGADRVVKVWSADGLMHSFRLPEEKATFLLGIPYFLRFDGQRIYYNDDLGLYYIQLPKMKRMATNQNTAAGGGGCGAGSMEPSAVPSSRNTPGGVVFNEHRDL